MHCRLALFTLAACAGPLFSQSHIAPTEAESPAEEQKSFRLPPGFAVQLVAAEPDIGKPTQMKFDAKGRLWVSTTRHYPFPATGNVKPSDRLFILSDFGPDGKAKKVETFANDLNIPVGILPLPDCKSCLVSIVGSILKLTDTDNDGKADKRETILTGFGTVDTHGMMNSFLLLPDGWVYATHGFRNESVLKAKDGSEVRMQSGNTFRFRPDGSRVEQWTHGQVNPFGLCLDPWMNMYTADCHSKPITQLIHGAYYQSFGKPHDGLGFAPHVTAHGHDSTALCGLVWYEANLFPKEWNGVMFLGNVTGNRINCDRIKWEGATPVAEALPDFLTSTDPWFRPTDIQLGPDGALYVADFYNRIIGHYEVDLKHPLRDKDRGRVWRIFWKGKDSTTDTAIRMDITSSTIPELYSFIFSDNINTRLHATLQLMRHISASTDARNIIEKLSPPSGANPAGFLLISRLFEKKTLTDQEKADSIIAAFSQLRNDKDHNEFSMIGRLFQSRMIPDWGKDAARLRHEVLQCLSHSSAHGRMAAVDVLIARPHTENLAPLARLLEATPESDTHLRYATRIALRNALRDTRDGWTVAQTLDSGTIAEVALGVHSHEAATFLRKQIEKGKVQPAFAEHVGRDGTDADAAAVMGKVKASPPVVLALVRGLQARGASLSGATKETAESVCRTTMNSDLRTAVDLAVALRSKSLFDPLAALLRQPKLSDDQRGSILSALLTLDPKEATPILTELLTNPATRFPLQQKAAEVLGGSNRPDARAVLLQALQTAPAKLASVLATSLASSPPGIVALLDAVKAGKASVRLLQEPPVAFRIALSEKGKFKSRLNALTKGLPSADAALAELIRTRAREFATVQPDLVKGKALFVSTCAKCHQIGNEGAKVGPQLDGIGARGVDRLLEDILDPNRNVDGAFRATTLQMVDGRTITGQVLRKEGAVTVLVDAEGKEIRATAADIEKESISPLSVMPANMGTALPKPDFENLLGYLLSQKQK